MFITHVLVPQRGLTRVIGSPPRSVRRAAAHQPETANSAASTERYPQLRVTYSS